MVINKLTLNLTLPCSHLFPNSADAKAAKVGSTKTEKSAEESTKAAKADGSVSAKAANSAKTSKASSKTAKSSSGTSSGKAEKATATPEATGKVNLIILTEGGCPPCEAQITGPLNDMITLPGFADILNVRQFSFGNNYFVTKRCGGTDVLNQTKSGYNQNYSSDTRHCWAINCVNTADPMDDCFGPGPIVTQHGPKEMEYNKMQACAQNVAGYDNWQPYWPFLVCMEANYGSPFDDNTIETATKCAEEDGSYYQDKVSELLGCYKSSDGDKALIEMAKNTFDHPGTPTILVNGGAPMLSGFWNNATTAKVCSQYDGDTPPPACASLLEEEAKYKDEVQQAIEGFWNVDMQ